MYFKMLKLFVYNTYLSITRILILDYEILKKNSLVYNMHCFLKQLNL